MTIQPSVAGFTYVDHPVVVPDHPDGREARRWPVLIAGGGPVGLAAALALARRGVACVVIEADRTVCVGSRAICLSRRTLEILDRLGVLQPFAEKGLPWTGGRSFYGSTEVLHFHMPHDADQRVAPMVNLQQYYIEQFLLDATRAYPDLIEIRWGTQVRDIVPGPDGVEVHLEGRDDQYSTYARYVVAADGARSRVRQALGLRLDGTAYEARYVIVDIESDIDLPTERLAWFDPPSNPGRTMLMHRQPDNIWRLDYQLHPDENPDEMVRPEKVVPVVEAHLAMMGSDRPWRLVWASTYRAAAVSLDDYRSGRVLFAGDAAHLVPIFGVRGLNSGFDDAFNLGWKLSAVLVGDAPETLLDSYSLERRHAWNVNVSSAMKSTEFMAPPSRGYELMRDAVLSLARTNPALATLINPRQSTAIAYDTSPLNTVTRDEASFRAGPAPGAPVVECPLVVAGRQRHLTELLGDDFTLVWSGAMPVPAEIISQTRAIVRSGFKLLVIRPDEPKHEPDDVPVGDLHYEPASDMAGRFRVLYDAEPSAAYLFRPDGYVCARWRAIAEGDLAAAIERALARTVPV